MRGQAHQGGGHGIALRGRASGGQPVDRHLKYRDNPYFESCMRFCDAWDQESFDPDYPTKPLEYFEPLVREIVRDAYRVVAPAKLSALLDEP